MFKVGDKVRCIDDSSHPCPLTKNKAYRVSAIWEKDAPRRPPNGNVRLDGIAESFSYRTTRFEKVKPNPKV